MNANILFGFFVGFGCNLLCVNKAVIDAVFDFQQFIVSPFLHQLAFSQNNDPVRAFDSRQSFTVTSILEVKCLM